jgi:hypothetical protein
MNASNYEGFATVTDPSALIPPGWTPSDFDPQQNYLNIHKKAVLNLLKPENEIDFCALGLEFLHFGNDEEDLDFAVSCFIKAAEAGDLDSIDQLIGVYEDQDCRLHDNKLAACWEARGDAVAKRGEGVLKKSNYRVVFNVKLSDHGYSIFCDKGNGDMGDRFLDAFDESSGFRGYYFLDDFAEEAMDNDDLLYAQDLFAERMRVIQCLKDGGFMGEQYDFVLNDVRSDACHELRNQFPFSLDGGSDKLV